MNKELALKIEKSEADHFVSWAVHLSTQQGNPLAIEIKHFGNAIAIANHEGTLGPLFNRVFCFSETDLPHLPNLVDFYAQHEIGTRIDINPYQGTPKLFNELSHSGLKLFKFHTALYLLPSNDLANGQSDNAPGLEISTVTSHNSAAWEQVWHDGFIDVLGAAEHTKCQLAEFSSMLCKVPGWNLYLAKIDGKATAASALYVQDRIGSVCIAGTSPEFRRKGCQTALLNRRIHDAISQGCDLVVAQSALGSDSQRNMEKSGLKVAYTRPFFYRPL